MNKPIKALLCAIFTFALSFSLSAQDLVFEMVTLTPKAGAQKELVKGMKEHNDTFHSDGAHGVRCYSINSGPDAGKIMWVMGPAPWSALDERPGTGAHDEHWDTRVSPNLEPGAHVEYYSFSRSLSHFPKDFTLKNLLGRYVDVKPGQMYRYNELIKKAREVYEKEMPGETFGVYHNQLGNSKDGRDVLIVWFFDNMGWMGEDSGFAEKYDKVHGAGSYVNFRKEVSDIVEGSNDVLLSYEGDMGGTSARVMAAQRQPND